jgi:hypothetical protein
MSIALTEHPISMSEWNNASSKDLKRIPPSTIWRIQFRSSTGKRAATDIGVFIPIDIWKKIKVELDPPDVHT